MSRPITLTIAVVLQWIAAIIGIIGAVGMLLGALAMLNTNVRQSLESALSDEASAAFPPRPSPAVSLSLD